MPVAALPAGYGGGTVTAPEDGGPTSPATTFKPDPKRGGKGDGGGGGIGGEAFYMDAALGALTSGVGPDGRPLPSITSTTTVTFKRSRFAGHAAPVASFRDVACVVDQLRGAQRCVPYAYRLAAGSGEPAPEGDREEKVLPL